MLCVQSGTPGARQGTRLKRVCISVAKVCFNSNEWGQSVAFLGVFTIRCMGVRAYTFVRGRMCVEVWTECGFHTLQHSEHTLYTL